MTQFDRAVAAMRQWAEETGEAIYAGMTGTDYDWVSVGLVEVWKVLLPPGGIGLSAFVPGRTGSLELLRRIVTAMEDEGDAQL